MFDSGIRDNNQHGTMASFFEEYLEQNAEVSIISAYFTIYAFEHLQSKLEHIRHLNFLFGEPHFILDRHRKEPAVSTLKESGINLEKQLKQNPIAKACATWIRNKVTIKSMKEANLLHGKLYHIEINNKENAILGSSNFTVKGLGVSPNQKHNIELNLMVDSNRDRKALKLWFDELWNNQQLVKDVTKEVLEYLERLYIDNSPQFIYQKTLFHLFYNQDNEKNTQDLFKDRQDFFQSKIWNDLFLFQQDGVKTAINKLFKYNGCILADSVGLGKTYQALAVIKFFELLNEKVLVLCPKKLNENWTLYQVNQHHKLNPFVKERFGYQVLAHTDLNRESGESNGVKLKHFNWSAFNLVVIDESHNFRNDVKGTFDKKGQKKLSRYERLMKHIIQQGGKTKVLLLSATPVNNDLSDLFNQIRFISEDRDDAFNVNMGIPSIKETLYHAQGVFKMWSSQDRSRNNLNLMEKLRADFFKLLDELTIARSRRHIEKYYPQTVLELGGFPKRNKPISIYAVIDEQNEFMAFDELSDEIAKYKLSLFNPTAYLLPECRDLPEYKEKIGNFKQLTRESLLIGMMKVNFLKRLESSIHSFTTTMERTVNKIEDLINQIQHFNQQHSNLLEDQSIPLDLIEDEEFIDSPLVGQKLQFNLLHLDRQKWLEDLQQDCQQLIKLRDAAKMITKERDAKLLQLKKLIHSKVIENPSYNKQGKINRKILIFTAFADTAMYLYSALKSWIRRDLKVQVAMVTGSKTETTFGDKKFAEILMNFSPFSKKRSQFMDDKTQEEIDILIATDCISEGQNLQDCDYLINYDIHWNPVRLIQRFGRIDRIGSLNETVSMINFWATEHLEQYLNLKNRVEARMVLVDITATGADNLLAEQSEEIITEELHYRDQQLKRMMEEEILDLEEFKDNVSLADFSLTDFRLDLDNYLKTIRNQLEEAPLGLYAIVPVNKNYPEIKAGVIFCLQQNTILDNEQIIKERFNPLQPFFLVYLGEDGTVHCNFTHPKQILTIFRQLCAEQLKPYEDLCRIFDAETRQGQQMEKYDHLIKQAFLAIQQHFNQRAATMLQSSRGGLLPTFDHQINKLSDFTLITWLVIKN
jgi:superfamily II DNA or RNA helicase